MERFWFDLRYAVRSLRRRPLACLGIVLTLGLAIGANTAVFGIINAVLLQPLPFPDADRLVQVQRAFSGQATPNLSPKQYVYWDEHGTPFEATAASTFLPSTVSARVDDRAEPLEAYSVTENFFALFGGKARVGRTFSAEENQPGGPASVVISHGLWVRAFGEDAAILDRTLWLNGVSHNVVGVMSPEFRYPVTADIWLPFQLDRATQDRQAILTVTAKLRPEVSAEEARQAMQPVEEEYLRMVNDLEREETIAVRPLAIHFYGDVHTQFQLMSGVVLFVLLIACINVSALQLAASGDRAKEMGIRLALGAARRRLLRQLLTESLLLAAMGGLFGLLFARWAMRLAEAILPQHLPRFYEAGIDWNVLAFSAVLVLTVAIATGIAPGLTAGRRSLTQAFRDGGERAGGGRRQRFRHRVLVSGEVALAVIALIGAVLLARSYMVLSGIDPGLDSRHVVSLQVTLPGKEGDWERFSRLLVPRLKGLPGVAEAAASTNLPMQDGPDMTFVIGGRDPAQSDGHGWGQYLGVTPGYFETLGIELRRGRFPAESDSRGAAPVVVINQTLARRWWPDDDPVGRQITLGPPSLPFLGDGFARTIVGVVADVREDGFVYDAPPILYVPLEQAPESLAARFSALLPMGLLLRAESAAAAVTRQVRDEVGRYDADLPVHSAAPVEELLVNNIGPERALTKLVGVLAALAAILSAVGIYGVLSDTVTRRRRELGVRMALGADRGRIVRWVTRQGMTAAAIGLALGLAGAAAMGQMMSSLVQISPLDPISYLLVSVMVILVAFAAAALPAFRAARIDPVQSIRTN